MPLNKETKPNQVASDDTLHKLCAVDWCTHQGEDNLNKIMEELVLQLLPS